MNNLFDNDPSLSDFQAAQFDATMDNALDQSMNTTFDSAQPDDSFYQSSTAERSISLHSNPVYITNSPLPVTIVKPPEPLYLSDGDVKPMEPDMSCNDYYSDNSSGSCDSYDSSGDSSN